MNKEIKVFNFEGVDVRTRVKEGEPWFCLKDVCRVLDISNHNEVSSRLADGVGSVYPIHIVDSDNPQFCVRDVLELLGMRQDSDLIRSLSKGWVKNQVLTNGN